MAIAERALDIHMRMRSAGGAAARTRVAHGGSVNCPRLLQRAHELPLPLQAHAALRRAHRRRDLHTGGAANARDVAHAGVLRVRRRAQVAAARVEGAAVDGEGAAPLVAVTTAGAGRSRVGPVVSIDEARGRVDGAVSVCEERGGVEWEVRRPRRRRDIVCRRAAQHDLYGYAIGVAVATHTSQQ